VIDPRAAAEAFLDKPLLGCMSAGDRLRALALALDESVGECGMAEPSAMALETARTALGGGDGRFDVLAARVAAAFVAFAKRLPS
jgi:hypothetical protein